MKALILLCGLFIISSPVVTATPLPVTNVTKVVNGFEGFHAHRQQTGVALAWRHSSSVSNFSIQHSYDGVTFHTINQVPPDMAGWNNYKDDAALPGFNYYRIVAVLADGTTEYSDAACVRIVRRK
jgi:hypothetical protein